jgi:hypothetical protein
MNPPPERVQPLRESCGRMLTIKNILVECTRYDGHRVRLLGDQGLRSVLAENEGTTKRIIEVFREIDYCLMRSERNRERIFSNLIELVGFFYGD